MIKQIFINYLLKFKKKNKVVQSDLLGAADTLIHSVHGIVEREYVFVICKAKRKYCQNQQNLIIKMIEN